MHVWRLDWDHPDEGVIVSWHPSKMAAEGHITLLKHQKFPGWIAANQPARIHIPTMSKDALLMWLNRGSITKTDNG